MNKGDFVRLKEPFRPDPYGLEEYRFGIIVGLVHAQAESGEQDIQGVVLYLYDPQTLQIYGEQAEEQVPFYFRWNEIEACKPDDQLDS